MGNALKGKEFSKAVIGKIEAIGCENMTVQQLKEALSLKLLADVVRGAARTSDCVFVMREQVKNVADTLSSIGGYVPSYLDSKEKQGN